MTSGRHHTGIGMNRPRKTKTSPLVPPEAVASAVDAENLAEIADAGAAAPPAVPAQPKQKMGRPKLSALQRAENEMKNAEAKYRLYKKGTLEWRDENDRTGAWWGRPSDIARLEKRLDARVRRLYALKVAWQKQKRLHVTARIRAAVADAIAKVSAVHERSTARGKEIALKTLRAAYADHDAQIEELIQKQCDERVAVIKAEFEQARVRRLELIGVL
jgi:hypothetical protein